MGNNYFSFFICIVCSFILLTVHADKRTEECNRICRVIKFPGNIGGCKCTINLFTKRSSELSRSVGTEEETLKQLRHEILGKMDLNESTEYELDDESVREKPEKSSNSLIRLIEKRILRPVMQEIEY